MSTEPTTESALKWLEDATRFAHDTGSTLAPTFQRALTLARRGAAREEVGFIDCHGTLWQRGPSGAWVNTAAEIFGSARMVEQERGPLRPLYAGPVEDNDG